MAEEQETNKKKFKLKDIVDKTVETAKRTVEDARKFASEKAVPAIKKVGEDVVDFAENKVVPAVKETSENTIKDVVKAAQEINRKKEELLTEEKMQELLHALYNKSVHGVGEVSVPVEELAIEYVRNNPDVDSAVKALIADSILKCENSDYLTNFGGLSAMLAALPVSMYAQLRMSSAIAVIGGFDIQAKNTQTLIIACLTAANMGNIMRSSGIDTEKKITAETINDIPEEVLIKIDKATVFRLMSKVGTRSVANIRRTISLLGGITTSGIDIANTKAVGKNAYTIFIRNEIPLTIEQDLLKQVSLKEKKIDLDDLSSAVKEAAIEVKAALEEKTIEERIEKVNALRQQGLIDEEDYKHKIRDLLSKI
ncbi:MAG TPA: hypothetical protein PL068_09285 [Petrotogaceae bacterium]|nr:hypothetical protein [Petrotogaceae bacterium]